MNYLFSTKNGLKHLVKFLEITKIETKKGLLGDIDDSNVETETAAWENLERQINTNKLKWENRNGETNCDFFF